MENLHMTYSDVLHTPYSLLLALQADKLRASKGEAAEKVSGRDMLAKKRNKTT